MKVKKMFFKGGVFIVLFIVWTILIQTVNVRNVGINSSAVGFADFNVYFHSLTGVNMALYNITDWLGLVPVFICMIFGVFGFVQFIKRKSLFKVDTDIIFLGIYYIVVIFSYLIFEMIPINYRPIFINGFAEASYPSSTTLLVLSVMPTLVFQAEIRIKKYKKIIKFITVLFSVSMVVGRLLSGVHWF
ncbi:MAG: phosphoesterase PA-phosphatase, partial [Clostridia bacterium]|nr:phosphoesterase PA-phosphatase [Clostridia bacterium]